MHIESQMPYREETAFDILFSISVGEYRQRVASSETDVRRFLVLFELKYELERRV
jgi:hypothetical protein